MTEDERKVSRRWLTARRALVPLTCLLIAGQTVTVPVLFLLNRGRVRDFEALVCSAHAEKVKRLKNTDDYLATPTGRQRTGATGGLNAYIARVSLPQLRVEVEKERAHLPASCRK